MNGNQLWSGREKELNFQWNRFFFFFWHKINIKLKVLEKRDFIESTISFQKCTKKKMQVEKSLMVVMKCCISKFTDLFTFVIQKDELNGIRILLKIHSTTDLHWIEVRASRHLFALLHTL